MKRKGLIIESSLDAIRLESETSDRVRVSSYWIYWQEREDVWIV